MSKAMRRPVPLACSVTTFGLLVLATGASGFTMNRRAAFTDPSAWADTPIWWQVYVGLVLLLLSVWLWRRAIRSLHV